jgi:RES domain-containing protein
MRAFRIADARFPVFDGAGARLLGGRWNSPGRPVVYASGSFALAMLEVLAHAGTGSIPRHHRYVEIEIPDRVSAEDVDPRAVPGWDAADEIASRAFGDAWLASAKTAVLVAPSLISPYERNVVINPAHPDFRFITATAPQAVAWDARLFR